MRLLIVGASGLLGINLAMETLGEYDVIGADRGKLKSAPFETARADFLDLEAIEPIVNSARPDWLINCAALANLESCEKNPSQAKTLNADFPAALANICVKRDIKLVHISTDAVFDGTKEGSYSEEDAPNPQGVYAQTKLDGERAVLQINPHAAVARVNFYGWSLGGQRSLAEFFVNNLSAGKNVNGFTDVIFCPMWVNHLSRLLVAILKKDLRGLYHVVGGQAMNKYQFGMAIARKFGLRENLIEPRSVEQSELTAKRSHNLWLSTHKLSTDLGALIPEFSEGLNGFCTQYEQGYPQKIRSYQQI